ncbi:type IV secretory system conjugative DNA transfer family protein [Roseinatronobacter monicus]|uniref:Type IV secretion system protein VirD4 n=1 Tax=Roseinatronobacter monicus TaxID=393481 RepID=A0A543K3D4_9RHOB|nr:type IV secretory system conjugative DNA transfer family protein [Roseinatronobacter monicus]TQM89601.1 type IV secretion system protein VirD4 [Roseinatronobacter monicus]
MGKGKLFIGIALFALLGVALGYIIATGYINVKIYGFAAAQSVDWTLLWDQRDALRLHHSNAWQVIQFIFLFSILGAMLAGSFLVHEGLTRFGETHWQTKRELKKNGFFEKPGQGFLLGKMGAPKSDAKYLCSTAFPHCLIVAPTGRGKGTGFVIPNLLTYVGSAVVLDVKGENFDKTSRKRLSRGDQIWRFAPVDWDKPTHRYNPLLRIAKLKNPDQRQMELRKTANLFLQAEGDNAKGLLEGGIDLFVACGILAMEQGSPTIGKIYRLAASGGNKNEQYAMYAEQVQSEPAKLIFQRMASTNDRTLTSYLSLLMTSGLSAWDNPTIDRATSASDFDFSTFRETSQTVYLVVSPDDVKPLAPLIRLFFSDLIACLQHHEPREDEPWPVMIMLDEFDKLGKMPIVAESIKTLRSYGGNLAIITQTIPALDEIYGENTRLSLQGGAGVKLYMTPSEKRTTTELSESVGMTTKRVVSRSRGLGRGVFNANISERTEERPLLTEDESARLSLDDIILVIDGQHPARAKRIKYFEDLKLGPIFERQTGPYPYPLGDTDVVAVADLDKYVAAAVAHQTASLIAVHQAEAKKQAATPLPLPEVTVRRGRMVMSKADIEKLLQVEVVHDDPPDVRLPLKRGRNQTKAIIADMQSKVSKTSENIEKIEYAINTLEESDNAA